MSNSASPHDGKHFVIQKGKAQCNQGDQFPQFKVTTHQKHYWNNEEGQADFLAVTEQDLQFNPQGPSFGKCKLKPTPGGYLPCAYAPAGTWQKIYDKVKVLGNSCVTEISELMCSTGGKIIIMEHGQTASMNKQNVKKADPQEQHNINPFINFKEFQKETEDDEVDAY